MTETLILVDENDNEIGTGEKLDVHRKGILHRCFSIFIFNHKGEVLLQKRAKTKYHSGGLWTNTCCGHPKAGESTETAAHRRLKEEMGFDCPMSEKFTFIYRAELDNGYTEHELDHVFTGQFDGEINPNPDEADDYAWRPLDEIHDEINRHPERFTVWSALAFNEMLLREALLNSNDD
jgi:isopentenyl-diphosphate delta-isomerase